MFQDPSEKLELDETATILDRLNPQFDGSGFDPVQTTIIAENIPFYAGHRLLDIADYSVMPAMRRFAVYGPKATEVLDFTNEPIYRLNREIPVKLSKDNIADYIRFFFNFVRGRHGRFLICENIDDIAWKEDPPPAARKAIGKLIGPVTLKKIGKDGLYRLEASMVFKDSLFKSSVSVTPEGLITLTDEELLIEDMPVLDDTFGQ